MKNKSFSKSLKEWPQSSKEWKPKKVKALPKNDLKKLFYLIFNIL